MAIALAVVPLAHADDHGDDRASATRVELPSETSGEIDPGDDEDWFRFEVAADGDVTAESTGGLDTVGALYDAAGNELAVNDDADGSRNFRIQRTLAAGTYYVRVTSFGSGTGSYVLRLHGDDHGDDRASATPVELPSETAGQIGSRDDADWFRFEVAASGWVIIESTDVADHYIIGTLYDAERNALAQDRSPHAGSFHISRRLDAGTYFVRVAPRNEHFSYVLRLALPTGTAPTVSDVAITHTYGGTTFEVGEEIHVEVTFDNVLEVSGRPRLALTIGSRTRLANYRPPRSWEADRGRSIRFVYTVQPSDRDFDGISIGANALKLNGGTIRDVSGMTNARLALGSHKISNQGAAVDGRRDTVPAVSRVRRPGDGTYEVGDPLPFRVYFSRPVDVTGQPSLALTIGETVRQASLTSIFSTSLSFRYVVQPSDHDADGISIGAGALTLNGGTVRRSGSNANAELSLGDYAFLNRGSPTVDGSRETAPVPLWVYLRRPTLGDTFEVGEVIVGVVGYDVDIEVTGEPQLDLQIGSATRQAHHFRTLRNQVIFQYVVHPADADADGISIGANALKLNGGTIKTRGGTANAAPLISSLNPFFWGYTDYFSPDVRGAFHKVDGGRGRATKVTVTRIRSTPSGGHYSAGDEITAALWFNRAVEVDGVPQLALTIGTAMRQASYVDHLEDGHVARDANSLYFRYVVQPSDRDADGIGIGADALSLNGGTITTQGSGTNAELEIGAAAFDNDWIHKVNAGETSDDDHGDDLSSATRVALPSETAGEIGSRDNADWFRFEVSTSSEVTAESTGRLDAVGTLYDVGGNVLGSDDDSGAGLNFRIRRTLDAGTYFVRVVPFGSGTGSYMLRLSAEARSSAATP